ncbi:glycoside hydrolase family protein [Piscinibacter terrae]|uniref:Uncharacterized protein n=1 Tax=Piscinibacter terrae TaxID=2496871 RepID=A0A3N7HVV3_9BURK|nr:hypothetical protein [Albitalea terrae]RQP26510.1 hypothetical protein DZC73_05755 [Albitalea terrae]
MKHLITRRTVARMAALGCSALALAVAHGETTVTVDAGREGLAVNRAVTAGFNFGNWMAVADWKDELAKVPTAALRFPGGNVGDEQDMDAASLDTFKLLLSMVKGGPELTIQTRVFEGRPDRPAGNKPEDAARAVRMARERGLNVTTWEIGNEPDLFSEVRGDASWTAQRYCDMFRAQAAAIRHEDPKALIAGPAVSGAQPGAPRFVAAFVERCGDVVDVLTWHIYPTDGDGTEDSALSTVAEVDRSIAHYTALWKDAKRNPLGHQRAIKFGITEFGLSWKTDRPRFLADQTGALWAGESALRMAEQGVSVAHYFAYQGTGFHGLLDIGGVPRPTYYGFQLVRELDGRFVDTRSSDASLWAHAARSGKQAKLLLINTAASAQSVRIDARGLRAVSARGFDAEVVESEAPFADIAVKDGKLTLPARSMALVQLDAQP